MANTFVGFGFGAIQGGLFLPEVQRSGNFDRIVVAEINQQLVDDLDIAKGCYDYNIAESNQVRSETITGVELVNPLNNKGQKYLVDAIAEASDICTALPSFALYDEGNVSVANLLAEGLSLKCKNEVYPSAVIYAAENDARAADKLKEACIEYHPEGFQPKVEFSETVIGKMCTVVTDPMRISEENLKTLTGTQDRALLVESYNKIFVEEKKPAGFTRGLNFLLEKKDLNPFAIAKFLGQNATHVTLGYLAAEAGIKNMHEISQFPELVKRGEDAYLLECWPGLKKCFPEVEDEFFREDIFKQNASEAIVRMLNPYLSDPVERVTRDPVRKLGWDDRIVGAMRLAVKAGVVPVQLATAARLALQRACQQNKWTNPAESLNLIWHDIAEKDRLPMRDLILQAY